MKYLLLLFGLLIAVKNYSQKIDLLYEDSGRHILVYARNPHHSPVSVQLRLQLSNLRPDKGYQQQHVVPARSEKYFLTKFTVVNLRLDAHYHINKHSIFGDVSVQSHDISHIYTLPFPKGKKYHVHQGYNGRFSHHGKNALDFNLRKGDRIHAARQGKIIHVVEHNRRGCGNPSCHAYNNSILVLHDDGTIAVYSHIDYNGAVVDVGDPVLAGQYIGQCGATGYATGPHLHFAVFLPRFGENEFVKTLFNVGKSKGIYLNEKLSYRRPTAD